jgi:hypothetical protein
MNANPYDGSIVMNEFEILKAIDPEPGSGHGSERHTC